MRVDVHMINWLVLVKTECLELSCSGAHSAYLTSSAIEIQLNCLNSMGKCHLLNEDPLAWPCGSSSASDDCRFESDSPTIA